MSQDPVAALIVMLKADTDVAAEVGTRVYGGELPRSRTEPMVATVPKSIVLTPVGGIGRNDYAPLGAQRIDVRCFGPTPRQAWAVWLDLFDALFYLERSVDNTTMLHSAAMEGGGRSLRDPDASWPFVLSTWVLRYGLEAVA